MTDRTDDVAADLREAGFGARVPRGSSPVVIVVDPVRAYIEPTSPLYAGVEDAVAAVARLVDTARQAGVPVVTTVMGLSDAARDGGAFYRKVPALASLVDGSPLGAVIADLAPGADEVVIRKRGPSAFFGTGLAALLTSWRIDTVVLAGFTTSGCIRASATDAMQHGFTTIVVREAVGDRHPAPHEANLVDIEGKIGEVALLDDVRRWLRALGGA